MSITHVSDMSHFQQLLRSSGQKLVVVDFWASWCGPCTAIAPFYEQLAREYSGRAVFLKVDVDAAQDVSEFCSVSAMPTFHGYRGGSIVFNFAGADRNQLADEVARHSPSSADVSFSGEGNVLGAPKKVDWGDSPADRRAAAAAAAAKRFESAGGSALAATSSASQPSATQSKATAALAAAIADEGNGAEAAGDGNRDNANGSDAPKAAVTPVNASMLSTLLEMGFSRPKSIRALRATSNKSAEVAMNWCFDNEKDELDAPLDPAEDVVAEPGDATSAAPNDSTQEEPAGPKLSPEERAAKADELLRKAREKRQAEEKKADIEREKNRLRAGKEVNIAKAKHEEQQRKQLVEARRKEKMAQIEERRRIREQLAADKEARRAKFNMGGSGAAEPAPEATPAPAQAPSAAAPTTPSGGKIQFRLPDGSRLESSFEATDTVGHAAGFVARERPDLAASGFVLKSQYPKKIFSEADMLRPLSEFSLLPRGALMVEQM